jgi:hypothetical protein
MLTYIHMSNRQWDNQLPESDKNLLCLMVPGVQGAKMFSYHKLPVWQWVRDNLKPLQYLCRFNNIGDLANLETIYQSGFRNVTLEVFNEPNHEIEGFNGIHDFRLRFDEVYEHARKFWPEWKICFPGLSPGKNPVAWWNDPRIKNCIERCDYLGAHSYYQTPDLLYHEAQGLSFLVLHSLYPDKEILITEFCCTAGENGNVRDKTLLAKEYAEYTRYVMRYPFIKALCFFILGSSDPHWDRVGETFNNVMAKALGGITVANPISLAVAIFPSLQLNVYKKNNSTEWSAMTWYGHRLQEECAALGINSKCFDGGPCRGTDLSPLTDQQDEGYAWLDSCGEVHKLGYNLHSDSGEEDSHTFGIYTERFPEGKELAHAQALTIQRVLQTARVSVFSKLGSTNYTEYIFSTHAKYTAVLMELFSHRTIRDIDFMWARSGILAKECAKGLADWYGGAVKDAAYYRTLWEDLIRKYDRDIGYARAAKEALAKIP